MTGIDIEFDSLGDIVYPLMKRYKVKIALLSRMWEMSEKDIRKLLNAPLKDGDDPKTMYIIQALLYQIGYFPLLQGVYENFALLAARKAGGIEPDTCSVNPNINTDPFLIELFTQLFCCFHTNKQRMLVWDLLYSKTDEPLWMDTTAKFVEQNLDWANKIYWKWNELDFANLDNGFDDGFKNAIKCITYESPDLDIIGILENTPSSLIMKDLISDIEARCAPPDDQRIIHRLTDALLAYIDNRNEPSFDTIFRIFLSPLWYLNADTLTTEETQEVHSAIRFLEFIRQYEYPPIKIPSLVEMQKLGRNPARYTREMLKDDTKATIMQNVWPRPQPEEDITTWVFILDNKTGEEISNVINHKWPNEVTAKREYAQSVIMPQQDKSVINFCVLSTTMPSYRKTAAQLAAVCDRKEKTICLKLPRLNTQYFAIVFGPEKQTSDLLLRYGFGQNELNQLLWKIGDEPYKIWMIPYLFENAKRVESLGKEISRISSQSRDFDGPRRHSPHFHAFKICRDAVGG